MSETTDPLLDLVREYVDGLAAYNALPNEALTAENENGIADAMWRAAYDRLHDNPSIATTEAGAVAALRMLLDETKNCGGCDERAIAVLPLVIAYFEGRT